MKLNPSQNRAYGRALTALALSYRGVGVCRRRSPGLWGRSEAIALRRLQGGIDGKDSHE